MTDPNETTPPVPPAYQPAPTHQPYASAPPAPTPPPAAPTYGTPAYGTAAGAGAPGSAAYSTPGYGAPAGWPAPAPVVRSRGLGLTAMIIAAVVFVLSVVASVVVGMAAGPLATRGTSSFSFNTNNLTPEQAQSFAPVGVLMGAQILLGTVLGILALVLGIVAVATKRGRPFGVVAIILAAAAPIVSFAVYAATLVATLPPA